LVDHAIELHDRALALQTEIELDEAEDCCRRSLALFEQIDGPESPDAANVLNTLASICAQGGRYAEAEGHAQQAERIMERLGARVEGSEAEQIRVESLTLLGTVARERAEYDQADGYLRRALERAKAAFGPDEPEIASACNNLAVLYKYTGNFDEAEKLYQDALKILERAYGADHPEVATVYHNLGGLEHARGRFDRGEPLARKGYEIRRKALGPDHPEAWRTAQRSRAY
jgi:tetratricopeptide (TPR) repeat protein